MEIKDKIDLRKKILLELYKSWENWDHSLDTEKLIKVLKNIDEIDLDRQLLYLEEKYYLKKVWKFNRIHLGFIWVTITSSWIDLIENKEEFNHLFKIEVNNISDVTNSIISIWNNNKVENINNEIEKFIDVINKKNIDKKDEIKLLLEEFKNNNNKSNLIDIFSILWNWASINSMIIALSTLIK